MTSDATELPELTERQERILSFIVREYTSKPEPIGSKYLADHYLQNVSSATIRNDMARLEELGLLAAPHTSAGRIPTEVGYRYFVKRLLDEHERARELPVAERRVIAEQFKSAPSDVESWLRLAVGTLARATHGAAVATPPAATVNRRSQFKHLALISTQGRRVMMVLVLISGTVRQQMLTLAEVLSQDTLSNVSNRLNTLCEIRGADQIRALARGADNMLEREILDLIADTLDEVDRAPVPLVYREGLSTVLSEFTESEGAQQALRLIEESSALHGIISEALNDEIGQVKVVVAGDGRWDQVRHLGLVLSRYGVRGRISGALIALGPLRMRYGRAISAVEYMSGLMSTMLYDMYGYSQDDEDETPDAQLTTG